MLTPSGLTPNGERLLSSHRLFATGDLDEARERIACAYQPHKLAYTRRAQPLNASFHRAKIGSGMTLNLLSYGADMIVEPGALENFYLVQIPLSGQCEIFHQGRSFTIQKATGSIISPFQPASMRWSGDCNQLMLQIDRRVLGRFIEHSYRYPVHDPLIFEPELPLESPCGAGLKHFLFFLAEEVERNAALFALPAMADRLTAPLLSLLLSSHPHNYRTVLSWDRSAITPAALKRAIDFIETNLSQPIGLNDIVQSSGASVRSLFDSFHRFRNCTPMAYLKNRRLESARNNLVAGSSPSVTAIALACGFTHFSNFAADYKRFYGESPSQTLRYAKRATPNARTPA